MIRPFFHEPVLLRETIDSLSCRPGGIYFDGTLGVVDTRLRFLKEQPRMEFLSVLIVTGMPCQRLNTGSGLSGIERCL